MKIRNWITTIGLYLCLILILWLCLAVTIGSYKDFFPINAIDLTKFPKLFDVFKENNPKFLLILSICESLIAILVGCLLYKYRFKFKNKIVIKIINSKVLTIILFIIIIGLSILYFKYDHGKIFSDLSDVYQTAESYVNKVLINEELKSYFERYPNNLGLLWYEIGIFKLFGVNNFNIFMTNLVLFTSSIMFAFFAIYKRFNSVLKANIFLILITLFLPIYAYISFLYTDIIAAAFFLIFFGILILTSNKNKLSIPNIIILSIIGAVGASFRANLYFPIIALIIWLLLYEKKWRKFTFIIVIAIVLGYNFAFKSISSTTFDFNLKSNAFPATHWIRMGQNSKSKGNYSSEDYKHTLEQINVKHNKNIFKDNLTDAIYRIKVKGFSGNVVFYTNKLSNAWGNGDFGVFNNLSIFSENKHTITEFRNDKKFILLPKKFSVTNKAYFTRIFLDIYSRIFYVILSLSIINVLKKKHYINNRLLLIFVLTFTATIIFLLAWESRARYAFSIMPSLILVISYVLVSKDKTNEVSKLKGEEYEID